MDGTKRQFLKFLTMAAVAGTCAADNTGTVSIVGKNVDTSDPKTVGITLILDGTKWTKAEAGGADHFFKTKGGIYVKVAPNLVILRDAANKTRVGQLNPLEPATAKKGDKGTGKSDETGVAFTWEIV